MERKYIQHGKTTQLFWLCWLAYFAANLGRLSFATSMTEILRAEGFANATGGMISTGFFICYGVGQLISGYVGDRVSPGGMIGFGLFFTGVCNLLMGLCAAPVPMLVIWCANGAVQSMLWPPILRIVAEVFAPEYRKKVCVNLATTYPAALLLSYGVCAAVIALWHWRGFFWLYAALLFGFSFFWLLAFPRLMRHRTLPAEEEAAPCVPPAPSDAPKASRKRLPWLVLALFCSALMMQGMLRDGLMTWVPTYLANTFRMDSSAAILSTAVLPIINLGGVYATNWLYRRLRNEAKTAMLLFALSCVATLLLIAEGRASIILSLLCFALVTASMMGINLLLVSFVPTYFAPWNKVSFLTGLTNAMVYVGSSVATYGIGAIADRFGWSMLLVTLFVVAAVGALLCVAAILPWRRFLQEER